jgi:hypothetical protein
VPTRVLGQIGKGILQIQETSGCRQRAPKALHGLGHALLEFLQRISSYGTCSCRSGTDTGNLDDHEDSFPWEMVIEPPIVRKGSSFLKNIFSSGFLAH